VVVQPRTMEGLEMRAQFWSGKRVLMTGHTGFKGSWLSLWLQKMGALVAGYALPPAPGETLFELASVAKGMHESVYADIRNLDSLSELVQRFHPEIIFHLAAQPLVRVSYREPVETFQTNVMGTVNLLEAVRRTPCCRTMVMITSDKCYENNEWLWPYRENDVLGGYDPYSSSKGCAELVISAYRRSFFGTERPGRVAVASARAGNVIGGGDFAKDRLVPDAMRAMLRGQVLRVRSPEAIRPWQHVLEPLCGYLLLAERLWESSSHYAESWNFGPSQDDARSVRWVLEKLKSCLREGFSWEADGEPAPHEAHLLTLDSAKARTRLGWQPRWTLDFTLQAITDWYESYKAGKPVRHLTLQQIATYESDGARQTPRYLERSEISQAPVA
jgi:CDP-glucose 4,6-dehydratase